MTRFVINPHAIHELLTDRNGPVGKDLARRAINVESAAKVYAGAGHPDHPNVQTGRLRSSIAWSYHEDERGLVVRIGSNVEYAPFVEKGTDRAKAYPYLAPALEAARA